MVLVNCMATVDVLIEGYTSDDGKGDGNETTCCTMSLVKTDKGKVAICGDVFWKKGLPKVDPYADSPKELVKSRAKVLEMADFIVPGHSGMYSC